VVAARGISVVEIDEIDLHPPETLWGKSTSKKIVAC
jgi:hypothetical protein